MKTVDCVQRSPEWHAARRGVFTASDFGPFLIGTDKKSENARQNFIDTKIGEIFDGDRRVERPDGSILVPKDYQDYDMERGTILEPLALDAFSRHTEIETESVGFILHDNALMGCSPDAMLITLDTIGLEMKCPSGKIQHRRIRENVTPSEYLFQIHGSMVITGADEWHFWSWHPTMPYFHRVERRSSLTADLERALLALCEEMRRQYQELCELRERQAA